MERPIQNFEAITKVYQDQTPRKIEERCLVSPGKSSSAKVLGLMAAVRDCCFERSVYSPYSSNVTHLNIICFPT